MSVQHIVNKLKKEINERNRKDIIDNLEEMLSENSKELSKNQSFFQLPLKNVLEVISRISFNSFDESDDVCEILQCIIKNTISAHYKEKKTLLILQNIDISQIFLTYENILSLFELFTNCPILQYFCNLYNERQQLPEKDYEYELNQKDKEIEKMKSQIILEKPKDFEPDIFKACKFGKLSSVQWLIEKEHIDKNKKVDRTDFSNDFYRDDTAIHISCSNGNLPIVEYLIGKQKVDIDTKGYDERTPLQCACKGSHLQIAEYLIIHGANINAKDNNGNYVIHYASNSDLLQIVKYLIENRKVDLNTKGYFERTPLHKACENGYLPIVDYLISKGANIEAKDKEGKTPLHYACSNNHSLIVGYLISKGANIEAMDENGRTPLHHASYSSKIDIVKFLISKGAIKKAKDKFGYTPYNLAQITEVRDILK